MHVTYMFSLHLHLMTVLCLCDGLQPSSRVLPFGSVCPKEAILVTGPVLHHTVCMFGRCSNYDMTLELQGRSLL